ncbi:MAG TPA: hypothetical protein VG890_10605 [Puia sp.]|nr:hypothetical protein [Puia sp.]
MTYTHRIIVALVICTSPLTTFCQQDSTGKPGGFVQQDIKDWLVQHHWTKPKTEKNNFLLILPIVASNPTAGFIYGAGLSYAFQAFPGGRFSSATANASYSSKHVLNLNVKSNAFAVDDRLVLNGDWRYQINSETTYGLGSKKYPGSYININGYQVAKDSIGQPLQYTLIRLYETASWKIIPNLFAGIGFHYDNYFNIKDQTVQDGDTAFSFHYQYSRHYGFNPDSYVATGFSANLLFDNRDNQVNAYKGYYANVNYRVNFTGLGSSRGSSMLLTEYRSFHSLDGGKNRNILAFWFYGNFVTSGEVPYLLLPAIGYDQRQRTGRGYTFGRFRGEDLLYAESEYRFPISARTGILGGVAYVNLTSTNDRFQNVALLEYIRAGYGGGLRVMLDKKTRTRLEIDAGIAGKNIGFYLGAQETF